MQKLILFLLFFCALLLFNTCGQVAPFYGNSAMFQTNQVQTLIPSSQISSPFNFIITPSGSVTMSSLTHQRPFISFSEIDLFQTNGNKNIYLLSQISYSSSSFAIALDFIIVSGTNIYSWTHGTLIKIYYMVIDSTFPDSYICGQLDIINSMTNLANQPDSTTSNTNLNSWIGSNVVSLSTTDTKFIYSITQVQLQLTSSSSDQYSINIQFVPISTNNFDATVNTIYSQKIQFLRVSLFIYNLSVFSTYLIKITDNFFISSSLGGGSSVTQSYSGWNVYSGMQLIIGWAGFEFSSQSVLGFQFLVDTSLTSTTLNLQVNNIQNAVPKFQVMIFSISQLQCSNGQTFVDTAKINCYAICPVGTYSSSAPFLTTTLTQCIQCSIANCVSCSSAIVCTQCSSGYFVSSGSCSGCTVYNSQCTTCDSTQCLTCSAGYFYRASTSLCQLLSSVVCGDGDWVYQIQACDDANTVNGDGCSSDCKVEQDYICLITDRLPSGASFCKYNRDFYLEFFYLSKEVSSNTVHFFFKLQPSSLNLWTQQTVEQLLNPVTIVDSETGSIQIISVNSLNLFYTRTDNFNQIELIVDYGQSNLEGTFLQFNLQPALTGISVINQLVTQNNLYWKVDSEKSGVYLFSYDQNIYSFQSLLSSLSSAFGFMSLLMLILGCCVPFGKLIMLEALAVVQISYFSLMQFKRIPPTFIGLKNLLFSNGYNLQNLFESSSQSYQDVFKLMGLQSSALSNYNICLIVLIIAPIIIGLTGYLVSVFLRKKQSQVNFQELDINKKCEPPIIEPKIKDQPNDNGKKILQNNYLTFSKTQYLDQDSRFMVQSVVEEIFKLDSKRAFNFMDDSFVNHFANFQRNDKLQEKKVNDSQNNQQMHQQENLDFNRIIFQRILYEMALYGILVTSYLSWVSILHSFSSLQTSTYIYLVLVLVLCGVYTFLFIRTDEKRVELNQFLKQQKATQKIFPQKHFICTNFGQFSQVFTQITSLDEKKCAKIFKKIYLIYLIERFLTSILIVMLPSLLSMVSAFLIGIYGIILLGIITIHKKTNTSQNTNQVFKQQNKQIVRADLLQKVDKNQFSKQLSQNVNKPIFSYLNKNYVLRQGINMITIIMIQVLYLYTSIITNFSDPKTVFVSDLFIIKFIPITVLSILMINMVFNSFLWIWELKCDKIFQKIKIFFYSIFPSLFQTKLAKMRQHLSQIEQAEKQQAQCIKMINNFMEKSNVFQSKENPFLGIEEKQKQQAKSALLDILKIQEKDKFDIPFQAKKRKSWLIQKYWDHM